MYILDTNEIYRKKEMKEGNFFLWLENVGNFVFLRVENKSS